jgi:hypothetical protein
LAALGEEIEGIAGRLSEVIVGWEVGSESKIKVAANCKNGEGWLI